jgi:O-antigen/teichoic acid export membrane protein
MSARLGQLIRSIGTNWIAFSTSVVTAFLLTPFIVHHLGNTAYGVWTLVVSMIALMGLLDMGMRGAITRFVSRNHAQGNHHESARAVSAGLWLRLWVAGLIVLISSVLSVIGPFVFHIPNELRFAARGAILLAGTSFALTFACGVFGGVLVALNRFPVVSGLSMAQTLLRAAGVVVLLRSGHGILGLALWELSVAAVINSILIRLARRAYPELRYSLDRPDRELFRQFVSYSFHVFLIQCATVVIYYMDNLVVGTFISAAAVTFYSIGGSLLDYLRQVVTSVTTIFMPLASNFEARGENSELRRLLIQGTRLALLVSLPIALGLYFRGHTFIELWMGKQYGPLSGHIVRILLIAQVFSIANFTSGNIAFGMAKHRPFAIAVVTESVANLTLSIILVKRIGITGVAWGTVVPNLVVQLLFWPRYICKVLEMPVHRYLWESWVRPGLAVVPFGIACYLTDIHWEATRLAQFMLQIVVILPLLVVGFLTCFWRETAWQVQARFGSRLRTFAPK